jgi:hypothetical protein
MKNLTDEQIQKIGATLYQILGVHNASSDSLDLALALSEDNLITYDPLDLLPYQPDLKEQIDDLLFDAKQQGKVVEVKDMVSVVSNAPGVTK